MYWINYSFFLKHLFIKKSISKNNWNLKNIAQVSFNLQMIQNSKIIKIYMWFSCKNWATRNVIRIVSQEKHHPSSLCESWSDMCSHEYQIDFRDPSIKLYPISRLSFQLIFPADYICESKLRSRQYISFVLRIYNQNIKLCLLPKVECILLWSRTY